jgi:hypothetical protein
MVAKTKMRFFIFLVAFALANIALHAIINFHFYRIFGQELVKIEKNFIKKDEGDFSLKPFDNKQADYDKDTGSFATKVQESQCQNHFESWKQEFSANPFYLKLIELPQLNPTRGSPNFSIA